MKMWIPRRLSIGGAFMLAAIAARAGKPAPPATKMSLPTITCGDSTQASINISICAGATGAPAGVTIQWETAADFAAHGWSDTNATYCDASFSGNANLSRYDLAPNTCVTVDVGEFLFDNGASTTCPVALACGTSYVFRAFTHATSTLQRSDFTGNTTCTTLPCGSAGGCTLTQGYWKTHNPTGGCSDPTSPLCVTWPVTDLTLGTVDYDVPELIAIFDLPAAGNGLVALAHQLIAAKLNIAAGSDGSSIAQAISDSDALIGGLVIPPLGSGYLAPSSTSTLITTLTDYNEGSIGPGHCTP
jgi:hypothetical protein